MLVKVRAALVSMDRSLIKLFVPMLKLVINMGLPCLQVVDINLYSFRFKVGRERLK